ncbi:MAG: hypothetical protein LBI15_02935 [Dysgonamonadaceae bacterium]|nr:hypothetical protein [Dysgonamonadaceae bacterium]
MGLKCLSGQHDWDDYCKCKHCGKEQHEWGKEQSIHSWTEASSYESGNEYGPYIEKGTFCVQCKKCGKTNEYTK